jgi:hypothetical protein
VKKILVITACSFLIILAIVKCYDKAIDGFYLYRIKGPGDITFPMPSFETPDLSLIEPILDQPFYYLASGSQSFVFVSADGQFTLKFFKHYRWKKLFYFSYFPFLTAPWAKKRADGLKATYHSCLFCMKHFKEETALIYIQLKPSTDFTKTLTLYNRLGKKYTLALNELSFALQRYAEPTPEHLLHLKSLKQDDLAKAHLKALFIHILKKRHQGFTDKDPNFLNNFGFVGDKAISIDIGGIIKDPKKDDHYFCDHELKKVSRALLPWLEKHYPELVPYTLQLIEDVKMQVTQKREFS